MQNHNLRPLTKPTNLPSTASPNTASLQFMDGLRGLAALYVMMGHARWLLWEGFTEGYSHHPELYTLPQKVLAYLSLGVSFGHQAVLLFFVLSGFVIHLRYARSLIENPTNIRFDTRAYLWRRAKRLYPPFIMALAITFILDRVGMAMGLPVYFQNTPYPLINLNIVPHHDLLTLFGNLAFTMTVYVPVWGSNGPLWSLMFEWWFYMIYPCLWWLTKRRIALATFVVVMLFVMSFLPLTGVLALPRTVFSLLLSWWFGVLLADCYTGRLKFPLWKIGLLALILPVLLLLVIPISTLPLPFLTIQDIAWGVGFTGLIAALLAWQNRGGSLRLLERLKLLGELSYTLYVIHFPMLALLSGVVILQNTEHLLPQDFNWTAVGIVLCLFVAWILHFLIEKPFVKRQIS